MSGLDCLNLNVTVPAHTKGKLLPVMVFIHGGGFLMGANWWPQFNPARLVSLAADLGTAVIAVSFKRAQERVVHQSCG